VVPKYRNSSQQISIFYLLACPFAISSDFDQVFEVSLRSYNKIIARIKEISYEVSEIDNKFSFWKFVWKYETV